MSLTKLNCHRGDDELLMILMDAPNRWVVKDGAESAAASSLRQALRMAHAKSDKDNGGVERKEND